MSTVQPVSTQHVSNGEIVANLMMSDVLYQDYHIEARYGLTFEEFENVIRKGQWGKGTMDAKLIGRPSAR